MKKNLAAVVTCFLLVFTLIFSAIPTTEVQAAKVKLSKTKVTLVKGKSTTLKVKGTKKKVTWKTGNKKIATVSKKGKVTAKKAGKVTISAKVQKKTYKCTVKVETPSLAKSSLTVNVGSSYNLTVKGNTQKVTWSTSNKKVATVTSKGKITGKKAGTATISAKVTGKTMKCKVTVKKKSAATTATTAVKIPEITNGNDGIIEGMFIESSITVFNVDTGDNSYTCTSSNPDVLEITSTSNVGPLYIYVKTKNTGSSVITFKNRQGTYTYKVTVVKSDVDAKGDQIINNAKITSSMSDLEKARALAIAECDALTYGIGNNPYKLNCLLDGKAVCDGYSRVYEYLLSRVGVESRRVITDLGNHAWNQVKIDGQWYNVDVTWIDPPSADFDFKFQYFMKSDNSEYYNDASNHSNISDRIDPSLTATSTRFDNVTNDEWKSDGWKKY